MRLCHMFHRPENMATVTTLETYYDHISKQWGLRPSGAIDICKSCECVVHDYQKSQRPVTSNTATV